MSCIWNLSSICRFCHSDGNFRTFTLPNNNNGKLESYGDMLLKTFNISMTIPTGVNASNMICDECISSLTDAAKFKEQVEACENKFQQYVKNEFFTLAIDAKDSFARDVKIENNDEDNNSAHMKIEIELEKSSQVKIEKKSNSEFEDDGSSFGDNNYTENYTTDENIVKPELKHQGKNNVAKKDQKNLKSKKSIGKKIKQNGDKNLIRNNIACRVCFKNLLRSDLLEHLKTHKRPYNCKFCEQKFDKYDSISIHIQKEHSKNLYTCNFCQQPCKTEAMLFNHLDRHTRKKIFECDICHRKLKSRTIMIRHYKTHDPMRMDKRYECSQCSWKFANSTNLSNHIKTVHERIKNYHCTFCSMSFAAKKNLDIHFRIRHTHERPFKCEICQQKFVVLDYLKKHKQLHHQDPRPITKKKYKCSTCNVKFDNRGLYRAHLKTHPEKFSICDQCGMFLICEKTLKQHRLTHAKPRFACDLCDKMYRTKIQVQRHIKRFHLNIIEKSKCEICGKFVVDLKQHQLTHNNRRFACTLCVKTYSERKQLTRHLRDVHSGYKLYGCEICGKRYINKKSLIKHNLKCRID